MSKSKSTQSIDTLLADRARFEAWLAQLGAKASHVPEHVVARVRDDYSARLEQVVVELSSRADELQAECDGFEKRIGALEGELRAKRDARAEDELRALVGEYDDEHWAGKQSAHDEAISTLERERDERQAELARVRDMLAQATRPSRAMAALKDVEIPDEPTEVPAEQAAPAAEPQATGTAAPEFATGELPPPEVAAQPVPGAAAPDSPAERAADTSPDLGALLSQSAPAPVEPPKEKKPSPFDEIAFLKTVVGRATPLHVPRTPAEPAESIRPDAPPPEPPRKADAPPLRATIPTFEPPPLDGSLLAPRAPTPREPTSAGATPESGSGFRMSTTGEEARSLKCQECGAMNFPTEWYCEKCGGELATF